MCPFVFPGETKCAISGKIINKGDKVMGFPALPYYPPPDPLSVCYDASALRDEFNQWQFKELLIQRIRQIWQHDYGYDTTYCTILFQDESFIVLQSTVEPRIRVWFLDKVFFITIPVPAWEDFCQGVRGDFQMFTFYPFPDTRTIRLSFVKDANKVEAHRDSDDFGDYVQLSLAEWVAFLSMLEQCHIR